jgi:hypothetical protein
MLAREAPTVRKHLMYERTRHALSTLNPDLSNFLAR